MNVATVQMPKKEAEEFAQALKDMRAGKLQIGPVKRPWWAFWREK